MKKRVLPLLLALVMTVALIPAVAFAAPETAPGGGIIKSAVTDAWSPIMLNTGAVTGFEEDTNTLYFSVSAYGLDSIVVCMEMDPGTVLRDTRVFLNKIGVPIRYALPGDCSYYDGLSFYQLFDMNIKSIVIPTWVLREGKAKEPVDGIAYTESKGSIELWDAEGNVVVYNLCFYTDFDSIPATMPSDSFPFTTTINAPNVNIRTEASVNSASKGKFAMGETVQVLAIDGNWAKVVSQSTGIFTVSLGGASDPATTAVEQAMEALLNDAQAVYVHVAYLNKPYDGPIAGSMLKSSTLYGAATSTGDKLGTVLKGASVTLLAREGTFFMIECDGVVGYVYGPDVQTW